jgi:hypothetical protein
MGPHLFKELSDGSYNARTEGSLFTKWSSVEGILSIGEGRRERDLDHGLCARLGGIQVKFLRCAQARPTDVAQAIAGIPVAGAAVLDEPLFVDAGAIGYRSLIENGQVRNKRQVADGGLSNASPCYEWGLSSVAQR